MSFLLLTLLACGANIVELYAQEREAALRVDVSKTDPWSPDAQLHISAAGLDAAVGAALKASVSGKLPPLKISLPLGQSAELTPSLVVKKVSVTPSGDCSPCIDFDGDLLGSAAWVGPLGISGSFPFAVGAAGVLAVDVAEDHIVSARLKTIKSLRVSIFELGRFGVNPSSTLETWLTRRILETAPSLQIAKISRSALPLRRLKPTTTKDGLTLDLLTNVPGSIALPALSDPTEDLSFAISESALLGLARRAAFTQGTISHDVAADPRMLVINGQQFIIGLRLWRLQGRGWWRDYTINGNLEIENGKLKLKPDKVEAAGHSAGAGLVDPLYALFEGQIVKVLEDAVATTLPASRQSAVGSVQLGAEVTTVRGDGGALVVGAKLSVVEAVK